jgi:hypothetical protein
MEVDVGPGLTLTMGGEAARLTPAAAFELAERLIRGATRQMIEDEVATVEERPIGKRRSARVRQ